jgi:RNA polymerase sigma-70 factor (ECF subfamily)
MADAKELMARYCDGDASAFRELYALVSPRLYGYLVKMARQRSLADDLLQQTFMKVLRPAYIRGADPFRDYAIAHVILDETRRKKRSCASATGTTAGAQAIHGEPRTAATSRARIPARGTLDALAELPAQQREAVVLTKLDGKSVAEAAEIAGTTVGAMKVRAHRGYEALRKLLGRPAPAPPAKAAGGKP